DWSSDVCSSDLQQKVPINLSCAMVGVNQVRAVKPLPAVLRALVPAILCQQVSKVVSFRYTCAFQNCVGSAIPQRLSSKLSTWIDSPKPSQPGATLQLQSSGRKAWCARTNRSRSWARETSQWPSIFPLMHSRKQQSRT